MQPPDPDQISLGTKIAGFFTSLAATAWGVYKAIERKIDTVDKKVETRASVEEMNRQRDNIAELFAQQRQDKTELLNALEDKRTTVTDAVDRLTAAFHEFSRHTAEEMGKRPTREEARTMFQDQRQPRRQG